MKKILGIFAITAAIVGATTSCSDFLTEDNKAGSTADLEYSSETGIKNLVSAMYSYGRIYWGKEGAHGLTEGGTDLFFRGGDNQQKGLVTYDFDSECPGTTSAANKNSTALDQYWEALHAGVDVCNNAIKYSGTNTKISEQLKNSYIGQAYFMRSLLQLQMVALWGPIPFHEDVISSPSSTPTRLSEAEVYEKILSSLEKSMELLKGNTADATGDHANYYSAEALYARTALYAASWLGKKEYYQIALNAAKDVIANSGKSLYSRTSDTWNMVNEDADKNLENLFAVHYSNNYTDLANNGVPQSYSGSSFGTLLYRNGTSGAGNCMSLFYVSKWNNCGAKDMGAGGGSSETDNCFRRMENASKHTVKSYIDGKTYDMEKYYNVYGLGYRRYLPSLYLWEQLYKIKDTDQRYNATILDTYRMPYALTKNCVKKKSADVSVADNLYYPEMSEQTFEDDGMMSYEDAYAQDGNYYNGGYVGIKYVCLDGNSDEAKAMQERAKGRYRIQFAYNGDLPIYSAPSAEGNYDVTATTTGKATSDVYGDNRYSNADVAGVSSYPGIKKFMDDNWDYDNIYCALQVNGRDCMVLRLAEMYLIEAEAELGIGDATSATNTINKLREARKVSGLDEGANSIQNVYGESSVNIDGILRERALELCGEYQRWFDLKRTHKLLSYVKARNPEAGANISLKFYYRPIPRTEFDQVSNKSDVQYSQYEEGSELEGLLKDYTTQDTFWQNPGFSE